MMTEKRAQAEGLKFTGIYERTSAPVKERAAEIRKKGYKAYVVSVPDSPLSRGHVGRGYSVYAEPKYQLDKTAADLKMNLSKIPARIEATKIRHQKELEAELALIELEKQDGINWLNENGYEQNTTPNKPAS